MNKAYILYGENDNFRYYISNTNPVIWNQDINFAKIFYTSKSAEYQVLGDYYNYRDIKRLKDNGNIHKIYIGEFDTINWRETRRIDIL